MPGENNHRGAIDLALTRLRDGDSTELGPLLTGFRGYLLAIAHQELDPLLRAKIGPSDVVQDTCIQAQQAIGDFVGQTEGELQAWLAQILRRRCQDLRKAHLGAAKRDARREVPLYTPGSAVGPLAALYGDTQTPSKHAVADEDAGRLLAAMEQLPDAMREVVWLRNWQSLSFEEVGQRTGRTSEAARRMFARAIEKLGQALEEADGEGVRV